MCTTLTNKLHTFFGGKFQLCVMRMELNFVLNQTGFKFCVKIIEIKRLRNPKNQSQDWTRDFII
jgi:hypothetical protein